MPAQALPDPIPGILDPALLVEVPANERLTLYKKYMADENARDRKSTRLNSSHQ